jgi:hypothetical protein
MLPLATLLLALHRQPADTTPSRLLGALHATPLTCRRMAAAGGATNLALRVGDPIFGWRTAMLTLSAKQQPMQYYEIVERPEPMRLQVWFVDGKAKGGTVTSARRGARPTGLSANGLQRASALADVVRRGCGKR